MAMNVPRARGLDTGRGAGARGLDTGRGAGIQWPPRAFPAPAMPRPTAIRPVPPGPGSSAATRRLLAVTAVDEPGGAETTLLRLLSRLQAGGWRVTLTSPGGGWMREAALNAGHSWLSLPVGGLAAGAGTRALSSWPRTRALAGAAGSDGVIYLNGSVSGRLLPALIGARATRVLHVHDIVTRVPRFWRLADVVLAASGAVAERLGELRSHVVYGPVDADPPSVPAPWADDGRPVVGFVGRIEPRKGPLDLVRAAPAIRRGAPGARVVVIGSDPYGTDPAYTAAVTGSPEIEHHAWVANAPGLMRHLDVLVLPSYQEPFGTVLAEAMAVGTPVVATRVGGLAEVVDDGRTGRLVSPGDPGELAAAVLEVLRDRSRMSAEARRRAGRFDSDRYAEHVERLITG
jgi:glycosyltransferase involved in cell wall biosynthesis